MDVSIQMMAQVAESEAQGQRPLGTPMQQNSAGNPGNGNQETGPRVTSFSQAYPVGSAQAQPTGAVGLVDRLRNDFMRFQSRMDTAQNPNEVSQLEKPANQQFQETIDHAISAQVNLFQVAVSVNAGLTATHQSQSGVKTLVEKS